MSSVELLPEYGIRDQWLNNYNNCDIENNSHRGIQHITKFNFRINSERLLLKWCTHKVLVFYNASANRVAANNAVVVGENPESAEKASPLEDDHKNDHYPERSAQMKSLMFNWSNITLFITRATRLSYLTIFRYWWNINEHVINVINTKYFKIWT